MEYVKLSGVTHDNRQQNIASLVIGQPLKLSIDKGNPFDQCAVKVFTLDGVDVGFIPKEINKYYYDNLKYNPNFYYARVYQKTGGGYYSNIGLIIEIERSYIIDTSIEKIPEYSGLYCFNLAMFIYNNKEYNNDKLFKYLEMAKQKGIGMANFYLGNLYLYGYGTKKDVEKAITYYKDGEECNNPDCLFTLGTLYSDGIYLKRNYEEAIRFYKKAIECGDNLSYTNLAILYQNGNGVKKDLKKALEYYEKAVEIGDSSALCNIAIMYEEGEGVKKDLKKALEYYEKAAAKGSCSANFNLGNIYLSGNNLVKKDIDKAIQHFEFSAELGDVDAIKALGLIYSNNQFINADYKQAKKYYKKGSDLQDPDCTFYLGYIYLSIDNNKEKGMKLINKSLKMGSEKAKIYLNTNN